VPTYVYGCDEGHEVEVFTLKFEVEPRTTCQHPGCAAPAHRVPQRTGVIQGKFDRAVGYQSHLARFPGDPRAFTDGQLSKAKLVGQLKREGWVQANDTISSTKRPRRRDLEAQEPLGERVKREVLTMKQEGRLLDVEPTHPDAKPASDAGDTTGE
jgi:hypothetical protein